MHPQVTVKGEEMSQSHHSGSSKGWVFEAGVGSGGRFPWRSTPGIVRVDDKKSDDMIEYV
jgi:hypothetical protein